MRTIRSLVFKTLRSPVDIEKALLAPKASLSFRHGAHSGIGYLHCGHFFGRRVNRTLALLGNTSLRIYPFSRVPLPSIRRSFTVGRRIARRMALAHFRGDCIGACGWRYLRLGGLCGGATHARDRNPDGPRSKSCQRASAHDEGQHTSVACWCCRRSSRRTLANASVGQSTFWNLSRRSSNLQLSCRAATTVGRPSQLCPGTTCNSCGSNDRLALSMRPRRGVGHCRSGRVNLR